MLVQLLRKGTQSINELMLKSCCSLVNVCTGAIDEKWIGKQRHESYGTCAQGNSKAKFLIDTMVRNIRKQALINSISNNMQKHGIWMVYNACKRINEWCITNINGDQIVQKIGNCNWKSKYSQRNTKRWVSTSKATKQ